MTIRILMPVVAMIALLCGCGAQEQPVGAPRPVAPTPGVNPATAQRSTDSILVLDLYAKLTGRTILRGSLPRRLEQIVPPSTEDTNAAIAYIERELATNGITIVPLHTNFACVIPSGMNDARFLATLEAAKVSGLTNLVQSGEVAFPNMDRETFMIFYSQAANRTIIRPSALPPVPIHLVAQNSMSMDDLVYAMGVVLKLNGISMIVDGDKFVQAAPFGQDSQVRAHAPKTGAGEKLIAVSEIPVFKPGGIPGMGPRMPQPVTQPTVGERIGEAATNVRNAVLGPPPAPPPPTVKSLAEYYARLLGKELQVPPQFESRTIVFEVKNPLTKAEVLYAIEATLALEGLAIIPVDDKAVRVGKLSELPNAAGTTAPPAK